MDNVAASGQNMTNQLEQSGEALSAVFDGVSGTVATTATTIDGVASTVDSYGTAVSQAASQTDYWTDAVGNYDKSALEAINTTQELVEMGYKSSAALEEEEAMLALCEKSSAQLNAAMEDVVNTQSELNNAIENSANVMSEIAESENVSAEAKQQLAQASEAAAEAMKELETAQTAAQQAAENYETVINSGTTDLNELEAAAEQAGHAYDDLVEANQKATSASQELSKATESVSEEMEKASEESDKAGDSGNEAITAIASALAAAGITAKVKEITEEVYELIEAFSEAESIVVMATGATGEALDGLMESTMEAYSAAKNADLSSTAGAVGEINTRMGLTGDKLTDVTGKFLDFASVTGGDATSSVRNVTQLMNQWGIEADNLESVLDRLTYAGQVSGISVDTLSSQLTTNKAILEQLGFSFDEAIAMFSNFELAGTNTSAVMMGFRSALSSGAISSLDQLYDLFEQISCGAVDAADASEIFGKRAGPAIVDAVNTGRFSLDDMVSALENTDGTLDSTAEAAQTLEQKWSQATNNISTAFTSALQPTLDGVSSGLAGAANSFGDFLNEHPKFTKVISAIGVGLGATAIGIAGVAAASLTAIPAVAALGTAINAAIWPITAIAAGIAAVTAAVLILGDAYNETYEESMSMTATTERQYEELQSLESEYQRACDAYGETSDEALSLKYQVEELSASFDENAQSVEEFAAEIDQTVESLNDWVEEYDSSIEAVNDNANANLALIHRLEELADTTNITAGTQQEMEAIITSLNGNIDGLNLSYEDLIQNQDASLASLKAIAEQQAKQDMYQTQIDAWSKGYVEAENATQQLSDAEEELANAQKEADKAARALDKSHKDKYGNYRASKMIFSVFTEEQAENDAAQDKLELAKQKVADLQAALDGANERMAEIEAEWGDIAEAAENPATSAEAVSAAYEGVKEEIEALCTAYDEAYEAAYESFKGQFGLFDEAEVSSEATVENAQKALDSQLDYWSGYLDNIKILKTVSAEDLGITQDNYDALMAYVQDGSQESAGLVHSMVNNINSGNEEAVAKLANTVGEIDEKQSKAADKVVNWSDEFKLQLDEIEEEMQETIEDMNLDTEASEAASSTISAYIDKIRAGKGNAVAAAQEVANAVSSALSTTSSVSVGTTTTQSSTNTGTASALPVRPTYGIKTVPGAPTGYASGTLDAAPGIALVGEEGPELVNFAGGEVVYTADETARILSGTGEDNQQYRTSVPAVMQEESSLPNTENLTAQEKKIVLEIAGQGSIDISKGIDKETVISILYSYLKPVLADILQQECYEEGDLSYDY